MGEVTLSSMAQMFEGGKGEGGFDPFWFGYYEQNKRTEQVIRGETEVELILGCEC